MQEGSGEQDVRILSLKRLDTLFASDRNIERICKYGQYISANNYHYIDIDPLPDSGPILPSAYGAFAMRRSSGDARLHTLQSMVLFGNSSQFWNKPPKLLYITMVQLSTQDVSEQGTVPVEDSFESEVTQAFNSAGIGRNAWCIYYSLEFCDAVLFAADVDFARYQEALWNLTVRPDKSGKHIVKDTISIYGVSSKEARRAFRKFSIGQTPAFPPKADRPRFDASVYLGVQNAKAWRTLYTALANRYRASGAVVFYKKFGRSDVSMDFTNLDLENLLYIAYLIIFGSREEDGEDYRFGSCVVSLRCSFGDETPHGELMRECDTISNEDSFGRASEQAADSLYNCVAGRLKKLYPPLGGYIAEIHRSLLALLKKGFSEEYCISVLPSYISYLKFIRESLDIIDVNRRSRGSDWQTQVDKIIDTLREYYRALTLLDHSTIHDEKKFIQAPALNAFVCQTPPKLLALYTAVAWRITEWLCDPEHEDKHRYSFLIVPDFRKDVYSHTISLSQDSGNQVGIIYLEERLFYESAHTIPIMIHELAHKVGHLARKRELRAWSIFHCIAIYLLFKSVRTDSNALFERMAVIVADCLYNEFKRKTEGTPYLEKVNSFIKDTFVCGLVFADSVFSKGLLDAWQKDNELAQLLSESLQAQSDGYSAEQISVNRLMWSDGALYRRILQYICEYYNDEDNTLSLAGFFKCIKTAFSEAYSDLRMLEMIGTAEDATDTAREYHELISVMFERRDCGTRGQGDIGTDYLRVDAVCKAIGLPCAQAYMSWDDDITRRIMEKTQMILVEYLQSCANHQQRTSSQLRKYMTFENNDVMSVRREIIWYRDKLKGYFETIISEN